MISSYRVGAFLPEELHDHISKSIAKHEESLSNICTKASGCAPPVAWMGLTYSILDP